MLGYILDLTVLCYAMPYTTLNCTMSQGLPQLKVAVLHGLGGQWLLNPLKIPCVEDRGLNLVGEVLKVLLEEPARQVVLFAQPLLRVEVLKLTQTLPGHAKQHHLNLADILNCTILCYAIYTTLKCTMLCYGICTIPN